jgi:hypothetical protein
MIWRVRAILTPHGAKHFRDDDWKEEDQYTSSIAIKLGEITGAHVIYVKNKTREDSNYMERTKYKERIKEAIEEHGIKFLMDLHGVDQHKPFKICVGTGYDENEKSSCPTNLSRSVWAQGMTKTRNLLAPPSRILLKMC